MVEVPSTRIYKYLILAIKKYVKFDLLQSVQQKQWEAELNKIPIDNDAIKMFIDMQFNEKQANSIRKIADELLKQVRKEEVKEQQKEDKQDKDNEDEIQMSSYIDYDKKIIVEECANDSYTYFYKFDYENNKIVQLDSIFVNNKEVKPMTGEEIEKKAVLLPTHPEEYDTDDKLDEDIKKFINKWLDIDEETLQFSIWNVKRSWVFERFHTLNYLRALGDTGQGKTRFIDTLGFIHYKPIETSGASTSAPIFRIIDKWRGTLVMDEADLKDSDESNDIIKIINMGYEKGKFVMRCDQNDAKKLNFFDPYCPKVIATRKPFEDKATESRCLTCTMKGTTRNDIPPNLNKEFFDETLKLRNKLLMWRFKNFFKIDPNKVIEFDYTDIEPRIKQIAVSMINLFADSQDKIDKFRLFLKKKQDEIVEERRNSFNGQIVSSIYELVVNQKNLEFDAQEIINEGNITDRFGHPLRARGISNNLKELGFHKPNVKKIHGTTTTKRCIVLEEKHLKDLFKRYGFSVTDVTVVTVMSSNKNDNTVNTGKVTEVTVVTVAKQDTLHHHLPSQSLTEIMTKKESLALRNDRNDRNSVTATVTESSIDIVSNNNKPQDIVSTTNFDDNLTNIKNQIIEILTKSQQSVKTEFFSNYFGDDTKVTKILTNLSEKGIIYSVGSDAWRLLQ